MIINFIKSCSFCKNKSKWSQAGLLSLDCSPKCPLRIKVISLERMILWALNVWKFSKTRKSAKGSENLFGARNTQKNENTQEQQHWSAETKKKHPENDYLLWRYNNLIVKRSYLSNQLYAKLNYNCYNSLLPNNGSSILKIILVK